MYCIPLLLKIIIIIIIIIIIENGLQITWHTSTGETPLPQETN